MMMDGDFVQQHGEIYLKDVRVLIGMQIGCKGMQFYLNDVVAIGIKNVGIRLILICNMKNV